MERKLASVRKIKQIKPIEGADLIELAIVDSWQCVVKKGEFIIGDLGVYFEIDSFLPLEPEFEFLAKSSTKKMGDKIGIRLKTRKMLGELAQGLMLPYSQLERFFIENDNSQTFELGADVTETLGVLKYEAPISADLAGSTRGSFPHFIRKTDQERIQNLFDLYSAEYTNNNKKIIEELSKNEEKYKDRIEELKNQKTPNPIKHLSFEETLKLDGTSCTFYIVNTLKFSIKITEDMDIRDNIYFGHCTRNLDTKENDNTPWTLAKEEGFKEGLFNFFKDTGRNIAIQGELMGPKIQGNREKLSKPTFFLYEIWDIDKKRYLTPEERQEIYPYIPKIRLVPIINSDIKPFEEFLTIEDILKYAEGSSISHAIREGIVFKSNELVNNTTVSFKVINNTFLLKGGD